VIVHNGCTALHSGGNLHSQQRCRSVPSSTHSPQPLLFVFLVVTILTGVRCHLNAVLTYISFMAKNVEGISCTSFKNYVFGSFTHLFSGLLILCRVRFLGSLCIVMHTSQVHRIFSHSVDCVFSLLPTQHTVQKFLVSYSHIFKSFPLIADLFNFAS
jgi:hypothetical protein